MKLYVREVPESEEVAFYMAAYTRDTNRENGCLASIVAFVAAVVLLAPMLLSGGAL